jgi:predicted RNA-binding Zn-ribbon protein involved in translation (DUF1610 family)
MSEVETEVEFTCPKCGHKFLQQTTVYIEPPERNEGYD